MTANNGVHKTDEVCILEVCVCYLQISCNCWWQVFPDLRRPLLGYLLRMEVMKRSI